MTRSWTIASSQEARQHVGLPHCVRAGCAALHALVQDLVQLFEAQVPPHLAQAPAPRSITAASARSQPEPGWQGNAASAVVVLTEVLYGASSAWQPTHPKSLRPPTPPHSNHSFNGPITDDDNLHKGQDPSSSTGQEHNMDGADSKVQSGLPASGGGAGLGVAGVLEQLVIQVLDDFSRAGVWQLPTHVNPDAAQDTCLTLTPQVTALIPMHFPVLNLLMHSVFCHQ